ncbi:hypothetical protein EON81_09015 [bacterium]|nr:MAG: hypothetical protein EON81_09015 [bacterium]
MRNCSPSVSKYLAMVGMVGMTCTAFANKTEIQVEARTKRIPSSVRYEFRRNVRPGAMVKIQPAKDGVRTESWRVTYRDGKPVAKELLETKTEAAQDAIFAISRSGFGTSRGSFGRGKVMILKASGYHAMVTGSGRTALGMKAGYGHVAVDPRVIKLGSIVYVEGYGMAIASDTGGAIKGRRIDLCFKSRGQAISFGRKQVKVHVLRSAS